MGSKGGAPAAPDMSGLINAANSQMQRYTDLMEEQYKFAKDAYADQLPYTKKYQSQQLETMKDASDFAKSQQAQYQQLYQPLAEQYVDQVKDYQSPEAAARARGQAMGAVGQQFDAAGDAAKRSLESYGIDPSATRYAALDVGTRAAKAAATAAAGTQSDVNRELTGLGLESSALNIGNGLPGQVVASQGASTSAGGAGVNAGNSTYGTFQSSLGNPTAWGGMATNALGAAGNLTSQNYQNQLSGFQANQNSSSGIGSLLGTAAGIGMMFLKDGGAVEGEDYQPVAGNVVPPSMSPSGGAVTDDVMASVDGSPEPRAAINTGEFVYPRDVTSWLGEKFLQQQIVKARNEMGQGPAQPSAGPPAAPNRPQQAAALPVDRRPAVPPSGAYARGGMVKPSAGAGGGAGRPGATLPAARPWRLPYPGGSPAGAVRTAIPGV